MKAPHRFAVDSTDVGSSMTPMIDVVFQLLIYFLCTASFQAAEQSLPTTLPPTGSVAYQPPKEVQELELIRIGLTQPGGILEIDLNGNACENLQELRDRLQRLLALASLPVVLDIQPEVEMGSVVSVYDICLVLGMKEIHFAAPERLVCPDSVAPLEILVNLGFMAGTRPAATGGTGKPRRGASMGRTWRVIMIGLATMLVEPAIAPALAAFPAMAQAPAPQSGAETESEQAYLDALRERKLFRLLETYCRRRMSRGDATETERARYTIELANILAIRAQQEQKAATRDELWQQAAVFLQDFLTANPQHPQSSTLQFQLGVYELAQGELARQQAKLAPQDIELTNAARRHLRAAIQAFRTVEANVAVVMKQRAAGEVGHADQPTSKQLLALTSNTRFRLGQALLALGQSFPRHSADQTEAVSQAKTQFEAFTQRYSINQLTLESYLGRAECLRLLDDPTEAGRTLHDIEKPGTPDKYLDRALVLRAQIQLDQKKPAAARLFIEDARRLMKSPNPEMDLLYVQSLLELARDQSKSQGNLVARQLVSSALEEIDRIEKSHGVAWVSRAELLLAELAADNVLVEDPAVLARMADGQFRRGDLAGTVKTLGRAEKLARERGQVDETVEFAFRAASILARGGDHENAAERFATIAGTYANHPKAPQAQFMVAYCLGQLYRASPDPDRLERYEQALELHTRSFGDDPSAAEVHWLLGVLRSNQRQWSQAIDQWRQVPRQHPRHAVARQELARAYENWLNEQWSRAQPADHIAAAAIQYLNEVLAGTQTTELPTGDVPLALSLCRILLHPTIGRYEAAELLLEKVLFGKSAGEPERGEARRLSVTALLGQDKFDEARRMIETEFVGVPQELFAVVQTLEESAASRSESRRRQLGKLQLVATERLVKEAEQLNPAQSLQAEVYLALAYVNAGEAVRADEIFAKLRDRVPDDPRVLEAQADCFMQLGRFAQARDLWRQFLGMQRDNSPAWFHAKHQLALACYHSGDPQQALKIIQVTELLHPELGGPELKAKFEALKEKCLQ